MRTRLGSTIAFLTFPVGMAAALFGSAGRWDLPLIWACVAVMFAYVLAGRFVMDPDLVQERVHPASGGKDRLLRAIGMALILAHWVIVGLDVGRFHWSDSIPFGVRIVGLAGLIGALGFVLWAASVNPFFSPVVRIQHERGHRLVTAGPYRFVRHPGYAGSLSCCVCGSLALGSWWGAAPIGVVIFLLLRRTALEDRFLMEELEGYPEYAKRVRHRLLPGIW